MREIPPSYLMLYVLIMVLQNEAVLKACAEPAPKPSVAGAAGIVEEDSNSTQSQ